MPEIGDASVLSFSSEDNKHSAHNVLKHETYYKWKCNPGEKHASVILQLKEPTQIHSIDIGNNGSAFVEVLVGRSSWSQQEELQVLLASSTFMSPVESKANKNPNRVRIFGVETLNKSVAQERWDRLKINCTQPYQKDDGYGLAFIKLHSPPDVNTPPVSSEEKHEDSLTIGSYSLKKEETSDSLSAGSFFRNRLKSSSPGQQKKTDISIAALARDASNITNPDVASSTSNSTSAASREDPGSTNLEQKPKKRQLPALFLTGQSSASVSKSYASPKQSSNTLSKKPVGKQSSPSATQQVPVPPKKAIPSQDHATPTQKKPVPPKSSQKRDSEEMEGKSTSPSTANDSKSKADKSSSRPSEKRHRGDAWPANSSLETILNNVVFVLSGFVNPERSDLRDKAIAMGAKYKPDWSPSCTHLICAFRNTPKAKQVKALGRGRIVSKKWISDSFKTKRKLPTSRYRMDRGSSSSEEDDSDVEDSPKQQTSASQHQKNSGQHRLDPPSSPAADDNTKRDQDRASESPDYLPSSSSCDTEDELNKLMTSTDRNQTSTSFKDPDETNQQCTPERKEVSSPELPVLPDFFHGQHFLLYGNFTEDIRRKLLRYITAYNGFVDDYMSDETTIVLSDDEWDGNFDQAKKDNSDLVFLRPDWIYDCHKQGRLQSQKDYIIAPNES